MPAGSTPSTSSLLVAQSQLTSDPYRRPRCSSAGSYGRRSKMRTTPTMLVWASIPGPRSVGRARPEHRPCPVTGGCAIVSEDTIGTTEMALATMGEGEGLRLRRTPGQLVARSVATGRPRNVKTRARLAAVQTTGKVPGQQRGHFVSRSHSQAELAVGSRRYPPRT